MAITGNFERFQNLNYETNFIKSVQKLEYCFLVESTNIGNETFPYKTALPEANVNRNRITKLSVA